MPLPLVNGILVIACLGEQGGEQRACAFATSRVGAYQTLARRIGAEPNRRHLDRPAYGEPGEPFDSVTFRLIVSEQVAPTITVMTLDGDGQIRMDMGQLIDRVAAGLAGETIAGVPSPASAKGSPIRDIKVSAKSGWSAARLASTEGISEISAENARGTAYLQRSPVEVQATVAAAPALPSQPDIPAGKTAQAPS